MGKLVSESRPTARKPHRCENCGHMIPRGTKYVRQFCKDGGDVWGWISHEDCMDAATHLWKIDGCYYDDEIQPISEYENNTGVFPDYIRGMFPHVICRLEWWKQRRESVQT